ncbi:MFS transporter [Motilibacter aurantiacus]|uniref:MFS transporter n=1 Tax=Motilibacter aurantiacus TaxID=2714955 RepID=UPI0014099D0D|nr:MFS transporter [Motilibacter aurantiacus]NHC44449.1 MFS transporter [Motilibacter aurantiacus]
MSTAPRTDEHDGPGAGAAPGRSRRPRAWLPVVVLTAAHLLAVLSATAVTVALGEVAVDIDVDDAGLSWALGAYLVPFAALLLVAGRAGDLLGRRRALLGGLALLALAALAGALAQSQEQLLLARAVQGTAAAAVSASALALLTVAVPVGRARLAGIGAFAAATAAGAAIGLAAGGAVAERDWRLTLLLPVVLGVALAVAVRLAVEEPASQHGRLDVPGAVTGTLALLGIGYGLAEAYADGWGSAGTIVPLVLGVLLLLVFVGVESRSPDPLLAVRVLASRARMVAYAVLLAIGGSGFAAAYVVALYVQRVLGYDAGRTAAAFLPFVAAVLVAALVAVALAPRVPPRALVVAGGILAAGGLMGLAQLSVDSAYAPDVLLPMLALAAGLGLALVPAVLAALAGTGRDDAGMAAAALTTASQTGVLLGLAVLTSASTSAFTDRMREIGDTLQQQVESGQLTADQADVLTIGLPVYGLTSGYTQAFAVGALLVVAATFLALLLDTRKGELGLQVPSSVD